MKTENNHEINNNEEINNNPEINNNLEISNNQENYKYNCPICSYNTNVKVNWNVHLMTEKHKRNGNKKQISCDKCNYISLNHWNLKLHKLSQHSTVEERKNNKFYCEICDKVFFCQLYFDNHNKGIKHRNKMNK
jgi:hypothetical protein